MKIPKISELFTPTASRLFQLSAKWRCLSDDVATNALDEFWMFATWRPVELSGGCCAVIHWRVGCCMKLKLAQKAKTWDRFTAPTKKQLQRPHRSQNSKCSGGCKMSSWYCLSVQWWAASFFFTTAAVAVTKKKVRHFVRFSADDCVWNIFVSRSRRKEEEKAWKS